jgi:alpha-ketoglutarate-dependent taurine dioxygenase
MKSPNVNEFPQQITLGNIRRKSVSLSSLELIKTDYLSSDKAIPLVVRPKVEGLNLIEWAQSNRVWIEKLLLQHRAILFRGFDVRSAANFESFVRATSDGELLEYRDRSTPRTTEGQRIYTSTVHPPEQSIHLHNEGTYWKEWALKIYFFCLKASPEGGETPIADVRRVYEHIDPKIRDRFQEKKMMLVRNYNDGFGLTWQEVFQTNNKEEVEKYCREHSIEFAWKEGDRLRTQQIRPAIRHHPETGESVWFNHVTFFHYTSLEPTVRSVLLSEFKEDGLPYNTYYGDGMPIETATIECIYQAYEREKVMFSWQEGDLLMLDNMSVAHGREPYAGERKILVAMTERFSSCD